MSLGGYYRYSYYTDDMIGIITTLSEFCVLVSRIGIINFSLCSIFDFLLIALDMFLGFGVGVAGVTLCPSLLSRAWIIELQGGLLLLLNFNVIFGRDWVMLLGLLMI